MNALLVVIGGLLAAGGGLLSGWQSNWLGTKRDERAHAHELRMAQEAVRQDRLERTYTELGIYLSHYADWARSVQPFMVPVPAPDPMPPSERWRIETLVMNHGSPGVRQLLEQWGERASKIENADVVIRMAEQSRDPESLDDDARRVQRELFRSGPKSGPDTHNRVTAESGEAVSRDGGIPPWMRSSRRTRWRSCWRMCAATRSARRTQDPDGFSQPAHARTLRPAGARSHHPDKRHVSGNGGS